MTTSFNCKSEVKSEAPLDSTAVAVVNGFFSWYIEKAYAHKPGYYQLPPYKKLNPESYIFDITEYQKRIGEIEFFSSAFKKTLSDKLNTCNTEMQKVSWDSEPESQFNIKACDYLWYDNWVGGQGENIDGFKIVSETSKTDAIVVLVQMTIDDEPYSHVNVEVKREDGVYRISGIQLR
jgi:hypothetical protein